MAVTIQLKSLIRYYTLALLFCEDSNSDPVRVQGSGRPAPIKIFLERHSRTIASFTAAESPDEVTSHKFVYGVTNIVGVRLYSNIFSLLFNVTPITL